MEVGLKVIWRKQEAVGARFPVQEGPPVVLVAMVKSPVVVTDWRIAVAGVVRRLARVKVIGAEELLMGMGPKSCEMGVRSMPWTGRAVAVRVS